MVVGMLQMLVVVLVVVVPLLLLPLVVPYLTCGQSRSIGLAAWASPRWVPDGSGRGLGGCTRSCTFGGVVSRQRRRMKTRMIGSDNVSQSFKLHSTLHLSILKKQ
jgi:hypothetical protein